MGLIGEDTYYESAGVKRYLWDPRQPMVIGHVDTRVLFISFATGAERSRSRSRSPDQRRYSRSRSREHYRSRSRSRDHSYHSRRRQSRSWSRSRSRSPRRRRQSRSPYGRRSTKVDPEAESFIRMVANKVREQGPHFEDNLRERENGKPKFAFLWNERVSSHIITE